MDQSLVDQYCASALSAPITAVAFDNQSGARVEADEWGTVAITKPGDHYPAIVFEMGAAVRGAVAVSRGGSLVAVGDDQGSVTVYKTWDGSCVFEDLREGAEGEARAMRAMTFNAGGTIVATLSIDGIIRVFDIQRWERVANYQGFGGETLMFDSRGERILCIDNLGQPKLLDLLSSEVIDLEMVPGGVRAVRFTPDDRNVVAIGQGGLTLIGLPEGRIVNSFTARGSSGMLTVVISPNGEHLAAVTGRSVHTFTCPDLEPVGSERHGADEPTNAAIWDWNGVAVGGHDGIFHRPGAKPSLAGVVCCGGFGEHRVGIHGDRIAVWRRNRMKRPFGAKHKYIEAKIDRDGRLLICLPEDERKGVQVYDARTGKHLFDAGPDTAGTPQMEVGGSIIAIALPKGGLRWYDLKQNQVLELPWVQAFALSGSGTWLAAITPKGQVRVLDPTTGKDAIPAPEPLADVPLSLVSFINRSPHMLVMDTEGVLGVYNLTDSVNNRTPAVGKDVLDLNVDVDRLWGITGARYAAVRFQEPEDETATIIYVDLTQTEVVSEIAGALPYAWVDPETGNVLQPARGSAIHELDMYGKDHKVSRALPEGEWITFGPDGVFEASEGAHR